MNTQITARGETAHGRPISRVRIAAAAFCMQLVFGAVYGWSVFLNPLREQFGASKAEANLTFTITLAVLGATAAFGGSLQRRIGPRATATIAGLLYGCGVILSGFAPSLGALYLSYGVLGGIGLGLGYIVPLAVLIGWFPDKRGFITGLAVAGFGLGAFVTSPLATELIAALRRAAHADPARRRLSGDRRGGGAIPAGRTGRLRAAGLDARRAADSRRPPRS